jgi:hypothetical protein
MAVRIDADGNVASPLVAGTAAVFSLLGANGASGPDS